MNHLSRLFKNAVVFTLCCILGSCSSTKRKGLVEKTIVDNSYLLETKSASHISIEMWSVNGDQMDVDLLQDSAIQQQLILRARDSSNIIRITDWTSGDDAMNFRKNSKTAVDGYQIQTATIASTAYKSEASIRIDTSSSVQYSAFLMYRSLAIDTLSNLVQSMTSAMVKAQPSLDFIITMNSADSSAISLLGLWNTYEGFKVFEKQNTWGEEPYWGPYASNIHFMCDVVFARSYRKVVTYE